MAVCCCGGIKLHESELSTQSRHQMAHGWRWEKINEREARELYFSDAG